MITLEQLENAPIGTVIEPTDYYSGLKKRADGYWDSFGVGNTLALAGSLIADYENRTIIYPEPLIYGAKITPNPEPNPDLLSEARETISGDRQEDYGDALTSHSRIGDLWSAYLGTYVSAKDVAHMMILLKVSRAKTTDKRDSYVDIAGYAAIAGEVL